MKYNRPIEFFKIVYTITVVIPNTELLEQYMVIAHIWVSTQYRIWYSVITTISILSCGGEVGWRQRLQQISRSVQLILNGGLHPSLQKNTIMLLMKELL